MPVHVPTVIVLSMSPTPNSLGEYEYRINRGGVQVAGLWVKHMDDNTRYRFTVNGELWEKQGATWVRAVKRNGQPIAETMTSSFSTGVSPRIAPGGGPSPGGGMETR